MPNITLENVPTAAFIIDAFGRVQHSNQRASLLLERHSSVLHGMTIVDLLGRDLLWTSKDSTALMHPMTLTLPSGRRIQVIVSMSTVVESAGSTRTMVVLTPMQVRGDRPVETVTRVASWVEVGERVAAIDSEALCVAIGVTGLENVNECFSRSTGDAVITEISRRLASVTPSGTVIERIAGNRFVIVSPVPPNSQAAVHEIVDAVREPIVTPLGEAAVGCAAGVATGPSRPPLVLLDQADRNLTAAIGRGAGTIEWMNRARPRALPAGARLGALLVAGVANHTISAHFQPVVNLATGRVVEYEALARWRDEQGGDHNAGQFIGVAGDTGVIGELGTQVLESAVALAVGLAHSLGTGAPRVSVNVSASELVDLAFAERVTSMLAAAAIAPGMLQFELTDVIAPLQAEYVGLTIRRLREAGIRFALDGFGSHSANLLNLRDLDIDVVKLDPSMSLGVVDGSRSMNMLRSVLALAGQIGIEVIAKGIETLDQHELLLRVGCRYGQGYLYSPPRPVDELQPTYPLPMIGEHSGVSDEARKARVFSISACGALDAADLGAMIRGTTERNGADMGAVAVIEDGVRWVAWEMNSRCEAGPPDIEPIVRAVRTRGPMAVNDTIEYGYVPTFSGGSTTQIRSLTAVPVTTSDGFVIGALCLLWLDPMRPGSRDSAELLRTADHVAARIELAHAKSS
jgi:EAL domain-containing protein (putative c-di-GMP-specific phosphodiesterase class I)/GGDEF domain-containing protein